MNTITQNNRMVKNSPAFGMKFLKNSETKKGIQMLQTWGSKEEFDVFKKEFKTIKTEKNKQIRVQFFSNPEYSGELMVIAHSKKGGSVGFIEKDSTSNLNMHNLDADLSAKTPLEGVLKTLRSMRDSINIEITNNK